MSAGWRRCDARPSDRFCDRGFPTPRDEDWKYTNVRPIERRAFRFDPAGGGKAAGGVAPAEHLAGLGSVVRLVFLNGRLAAAPPGPLGPGSPGGELPAGVLAESLAHVLESDPGRVEPHLAELADGNAFTALNRAFLGDGAVITIPPGVRLPLPVELVFVARGEVDVASHPVVLVLAGEAAGATVVEHHLGDGAGAKLANPFTRIAVGEGAAIEHHLLLEEDDATWHTGNIDARVAAGGASGRTRCSSEAGSFATGSTSPSTGPGRRWC